MIGFLYSLCVAIAAIAIIWGIGSVMMNGVRYSSLGPCLLVAVGFIVLASVLNMVGGG